MAKSQSSKFVTTLATSFVCVLSATETRAQAVPAAQISAYAGGAGPSEIFTLGSLSNSNCNPGPEGGCESSFASASASALTPSGTTLPELSVSANGSTAGGVATSNAGAHGIIDVFYEIVGAETQPVTLDISGTASTSESGAYATAQAQISYGAGSLDTCSSTYAAVCGTELASGSLNDVQFSNEDTNTLYDMQVLASGYSSLGTGNFSATVDPTISIDPRGSRVTPDTQSSSAQT
jgi:hypothetical protein